MKTIKKILITILLISPTLMTAQTLGGYALYDCLASAVDSNNCDDAFVTGFPNDSVWVNFNDYNIVT